MELQHRGPITTLLAYQVLPMPAMGGLSILLEDEVILPIIRLRTTSMMHQIMLFCLMTFGRQAVVRNTTLIQLRPLNIHQDLLRLGRRLEMEVERLIFFHRALLLIVLSQLAMAVERDLQPRLVLHFQCRLLACLAFIKVRKSC